jgi:lipid-A-disaccharide synthase
MPLLTDTSERRRQTEAFARLDSIMEVGKVSPSDRSASVVLDIVGHNAVLEDEPATLSRPTL